ncbi:MAG: Sensor histidine kinase LiaS [candidate division BRC1 bacterium ADurb.BinA364]|nr:MAG: Sensor histidine kinase LiaS [candidate division BRC1 bacterium ADurb.BinA364]
MQKPFHLHEIRQFALAQSAKWQAQRDLRQIREQLQELVTARTIELAQANRALKNRIRQNLRLEQEIAQISNDLMQRVGRDLHDGLGQQLTGIMLMAKALAKQLESRGLPEAATAREIPHLVGDAIKATRSLARGLCPIGLDTAGLGPALRTLCADTEAMTGVACHLEWNEGVNIVDLLAAANLYYLTQEAIANAIRHGEPSQIVVRLTREHGSLVLSIRDDGKGFDPAAANGGGLGLGIMRHRAEAIGGSFEIQSRPGGGAIVRCIAPMPNECRGERG